MARLKELEEMAANLQATARELPPGQDRYNALREIGRFRARITGLQGADLRGLKAKGRPIPATEGEGEIALHG